MPGAAGSPLPITFEKGKLPPKLNIVGKGLYQRFRFILDIGKKLDFTTLRVIFAKCLKFRPFLEVRKYFKLLEHKHIIYHFKARDLEIPPYNLFRNICKFCTKVFPNLAKFIIVDVINFSISRNKLYNCNHQITCFHIIHNMFMFQEFEIFSNFEKWPNKHVHLKLGFLGTP